MSDHELCSTLLHSLLSFLLLVLFICPVSSVSFSSCFLFLLINLFCSSPQSYQKLFPSILCILNSARQMLWLLRDPNCKLFYSSIISHIDISYVLCLYFLIRWTNFFHFLQAFLSKTFLLPADVSEIHLLEIPPFLYLLIRSAHWFPPFLKWWEDSLAAGTEHDFSYHHEGVLRTHITLLHRKRRNLWPNKKTKV